MRIHFGQVAVELTGPICDGLCVRQEFVARGSRLVSVGLYMATYMRKNPGMVIVDVCDSSQSVVARAKADASALEDNSYREFGLGADLMVGQRYELRAYTQQCRAGQSPTMAYGNSTGCGALFVGARIIRHKELCCSFNYEGDVEALADPTPREPAERPPVPEGAIEGLVSVVVPHYNCQDYLPACLASLSRQTYSAIEVIVVDDGSRRKARTKSIVEGFRVVMPALRLVQLTKNGGAPAARNAGAAVAKGEYLFFCDSDVELYAESIEVLVRCLLEDQGADFAYGGFIWGAQRVIPKEFNESMLRQGNYVTTMSLLRRSKFPGWDETLRRHQDWDLWLTVVDGGGRGVCCRRYLFETPVREDGISSDDNIGMMESKDIVTRKHRLEKR
jgi:hypothetical protein